MAKRSSVHEFPTSVKKEAFVRANGRCYMCGLPIRQWNYAHYHHKVPVRDGGTASIDNCVPEHKACHTSPLGYMLNHGLNAVPRPIIILRGKPFARRVAYQERLGAYAKLETLVNWVISV